MVCNAVFSMNLFTSRLQVNLFMVLWSFSYQDCAQYSFLVLYVTDRMSRERNLILDHVRPLYNKSGKLSQRTPVLPQVATSKFKYKNQQRAITQKLSKQEL